MVSPILGVYYRRKSQYTHTGKIALCCIAKLENVYIRFFVEYHKKLHFDKIFIYDNNDLDGERLEEVINDYIDQQYVEVIDYRGKQVVQLAAYQDCYDRHNKEYDWIAFFDCDEFLTFADETYDIHLFLNQRKFLPFQMMHINWKIYGDNELLDNDGRSVVERFKNPVLPLDFMTRGVPWNKTTKSIVRGGLSAIVWKATAHTPTSKYYYCCNSEGVAVRTNSALQEIEFKTVFLRHYRTKSIGEWVRNKMIRGFADQPDKSWKQILTLNHFFEYNQITKEKLDYANKILEELKAYSKSK